MSLFSKIRKAGPLDTNPQPGAVIPGVTMDSMPKIRPMVEIGVSGLQRTKGIGYIFEEWLASLSTHRQRQIYREMRDNDAVIGALFFSLEMILRRAEWSVEAGKGGKAEQYAKFIRECMDDMSHTWADFIAESTSMFPFGFALFETVYKRRQGPDGRKASRFKDGLIGWRKMAPRAQESILYWMWDDEGGLQGAVQLAAPEYKTVPIPIEKLLLFRTTSMKNNPEGRSILRNCFRAWSFKKRLEEVEGVGIERDACGIPVLYASAEALEAMGKGNQVQGEILARQIVQNIRIDDQMGIVLPIAYDEKGNPLVKLELITAAGSKQIDVGAAIKRYNEDILNTCLAGFIQFGQTEHGARSLHMSATQIFASAIAAFMDSVAAVMNRIAIPRLMALNNMDLSQAPELKPGEIGVRDLEELAGYVSKLATAGLTFFDPETANYLRTIARLPPEPEGGSLPLDETERPASALQKPPVAPTVQPKPNGTAKPNGAVKPNGKPSPKPSPAEDKENATRLERT